MLPPLPPTRDPGIIGDRPVQPTFFGGLAVFPRIVGFPRIPRCQWDSWGFLAPLAFPPVQAFPLALAFLPVLAFPLAWAVGDRPKSREYFFGGLAVLPPNRGILEDS